MARERYRRCCGGGRRRLSGRKAFSTPRLMLLLTSKSLEKEEEIQSQWRAQWLAYDSDLVIPSSYRHRRCGGLFGVSKWLACALSLPPRADGCSESKVIGGAADSDLMLHSVTSVGRHYISEVKMVMIYRHPYRCSTAICSVVLHFAVPLLLFSFESC